MGDRYKAILDWLLARFFEIATIAGAIFPLTNINPRRPGSGRPRAGRCNLDFEQIEIDIEAVLNFLAEFAAFVSIIAAVALITYAAWG